MTYDPWDIVLLPFPFTNLSASKKRPAVVISPKLYNSEQDVVVLFLTSKINVSSKVGDYKLKHWQSSNLPKPSMVRMKFATIDKDFILKKIGGIERSDIAKITSEMRDFLEL